MLSACVAPRGVPEELAASDSRRDRVRDPVIVTRPRPRVERCAKRHDIVRRFLSGPGSTLLRKTFGLAAASVSSLKWPTKEFVACFKLGGTVDALCPTMFSVVRPLYAKFTDVYSSVEEFFSCVSNWTSRSCRPQRRRHASKPLSSLSNNFRRHLGTAFTETMSSKPISTNRIHRVRSGQYSDPVRWWSTQTPQSIGRKMFRNMSPREIQR